MAVYLYESVLDDEDFKGNPNIEHFKISKKQGMVFRCNSGYNEDRMRIINPDGSVSFKDRFSINITGYTHRYFMDWDHELFFVEIPMANKVYFLRRLPTSNSLHIKHLEFIIENVFKINS